MESTFTFTARSTKNPERAATFTIIGERVHVDFSQVILESIEKGMFPEHDEDVESLPAKPKGDILPGWVKPAGMWIMQHGFDSFPVADVDASSNDGYFSVVIWTRATGLRLAPIVLKWLKVDNPAGADAFVDALNRIKTETSSEAKKTGIFDYWLTWILGGAFFAFFFGKAFLPGKKDKKKS